MLKILQIYLYEFRIFTPEQFVTNCSSFTFSNLQYLQRSLIYISNSHRPTLFGITNINPIPRRSILPYPNLRVTHGPSSFLHHHPQHIINEERSIYTKSYTIYGRWQMYELRLLPPNNYQNYLLNPWDD